MSTASIMTAQGIPESVWQPIMQVESGGNAGTVSQESNGTTSYGLFQLNSGGVGKGYSSAFLLDPVNNAALAAAAMKNPYQQGLQKGLSGYALTQYVAFNSGFPTTAGVGSVSTDTVVSGYNTKLKAAYNTYTGATAPTAATQTTTATTSSGSMQSLLANLNNTQKAGGTAALGYSVIFSVLGIGLILLGVRFLGGTR